MLGIFGFSGAGGEEPPDWEPPVGWTPDVAEPQDWPVAVFIGDSYTAGAGGDGSRWTTRVAAAQEWLEVNLGRGGTGYSAASSFEGCGLDYCPPFPEMVEEAADRSPDVVIVAGGRNDGATDNREAIWATFQQLRATLPKTEIYAVSPIWDDDAPYPESLQAMGEAVRGAVEAVGGTYLDIGSPLEGRPELLSEDGVHPNAEGYAVLGDAVIEALAASK